MSDDSLKSSFELAMERLRERDAETGNQPSGPLAPEQKEAIATLRRNAEAKLAELKILYDKNRIQQADPTQLQELDEHYRIDCERARSSLDSAIARVRRGTES